MCVARLANSGVVPASPSVTQGKTSTPQGKERSASVAQPSEGNSSNLAQVGLPSLSLIREGLNHYELSQCAKDVLMASLREGNSKQYQTYLTKWQQYCRERNIDIFEPSIANGIEFIVSLYKAGLGYSAINTVRSALAFLCPFFEGWSQVWTTPASSPLHERDF